MIAVSEAELDIIRQICNRCLPDGEVRAFGSRVRGNYKRYSDLDLAVVASSKLGIYRLADIQEAFQESELNYRVDIMDYNDTSEEFRRVIDECYEVIWRK